MPTILELLNRNKAMEEAAEQAAEVDELESNGGYDGDSVDVTEDVEGELADTSVEDEIDSADEATETALVAVEQWRQLSNTMAHYARNGTITQESAQLYNLSRGMIMDSLGMNINQEGHVVKLSHEAGWQRPDEARRRISQTIEEDQGRIKAIVNAVVEFVKKIVASVAEAVTRWVTAAGRLKARAESISAKAAEGKYDFTLDEKRASKYGKYFSDGSKVLSVKEGVEAVHAKTQRLKSKEFVSESITVLTEMSKGFDPTKKINVLRYYWNKLVAAIKKKNASQFAIGFDPGVVSDDNVKSVWDKGEGTYARSDILPGGMALLFHVFPGSDATDDQPGQSPRIDIDFFHWAKTEDAKMSDSALPKSAGDVTAICTKVSDICSERKTISENMKKFSEEGKKLLDTLAAKVTKAEDNKLKQMGQAVLTFFRDIFKSVTRPFLAMSRYCITISKVAIDICALCIKGGKGADTADEGE